VARHSFVFILFSIFLLPFAKAQLNCSVIVKGSTCSANGSIVGNVSNGSGVYNYQLSSATPGCLTSSILQSNNTFNSLKPCTYTLLISDVANGQTCSQTITVGGNYQAPALNLSVTNCKIVANVTNGNDPFSFAYSTTSVNGPFVPNSPPNSNVFNGLPNGNVWVQVQDSCGNTYVAQTSIGTNPISNFAYTVTNGNINVTGVTGGNAPFTYTLTTNAGVFTNTNGNFAGIPIDCTTKIKVNDACTMQQKTYNIQPNLFIDCVNFQGGTLNLSATEGVAPYTYTIKSGGVTIATNNTGIFTGLPTTPAVLQYDIALTDACNKTRNASIYALRPFFGGSTNCSGAGTVTASVQRSNGASAPMFYPINVTCNSCVPTQTKTIAAAPNSTNFTGLIGNPNIFTFTDACGENVICKDSLILILNSNCTDINTQFRREFKCNNGTAPSLISMTGTTTYVLKDANGLVLETNTTGTFSGYPPGTYTVTATHPQCGTTTGTVIVSPIGAPLNLVPSVQLRHNTLVNGKCVPRYNVRLDAAKGPYFMIGGSPSTSVYMNTPTGAYYWRNTVPPGNYTIISTSLCSSINITLPSPTFNLLATATSNCPSDGQVTVSGAQDYSYWKNWFSQNHNLDLLNNTSNGTHQDFYSMVGNNASFTGQVGATAVFHNLPNNTLHTFYLYQYDSPYVTNSCPVDTAKVTLPEYFQLTSAASRGIICDGGSSANVQFWVKPKTISPFKKTGNAPYNYQLIDCTNLSQTIGNPIVTNDSIVSFQNLQKGIYCLRVIDACGISSDFQTEVSPLGAAQYIAASCSEVKLQIDTIPGATYTWRNQNGAIIGNSHLISIATPSLSQTYNCTIQTSACTFFRSINVPGGLSGINVAIQPANNITTICSGQTVELQAISTVNDFKWNTGQTNSSITVSSSGNYVVTATNSLGCKTTADININVAAPIAAAFVKNNIKCYGQTNGLLSANVLIGAAPFSYRWENGATSPTINNLAQGTYRLTITDVLGCTQTFSQTITQPLELQINATSKPITCAALNNGTAQVANLGGTAPFSYQWSNGNKNNALSGLAEGIYEVTVNDVNNCFRTAAVTITAPPPLSLNVSPNNATVCKGEKVTLQADGAGGTGNIKYLWNNGNNTPNINVGAGNYSVTISDNNNCTSNKAVKILESSRITPPLVGNPEFCEGKSTMLSINGTYKAYRWNNGDTTSFVQINAAQQYCVTVTSSGGCEGDTCISITQNPLPKVVLQGDSTLCKGKEGIIYLLKSPNFTQFQWSNNATTDTISTKSGAYSVTVTDNKGCQASDSFSVKAHKATQIPLLSPKQFCKGDSVVIDAGTNFSTYVWNNGEKTNKISVRKGGQYCLSITDSNNCISDTCVIIEEKPLPIIGLSGASAFCKNESTTLSATGNFIQYGWNNNQNQKAITINKAGQYCFSATDANTCKSDTCIIVVENPLPQFNVLGDTVFCEGQTRKLSITTTLFTAYQWSNGIKDSIINISKSGVYKITVTDANGCKNEASLNVNVLKNPVPTILGTPTICNNGFTTLQSDKDFNTYLWSNQNTQKSISINQAGNYHLTVTDTFGCQGQDSMLVKAVSKLNPLISGKLEFCEGENTTLSLGQNFNTYAWNNGLSTNQITISTSGTYCVSISDTNGCKGDTCAQVIMHPKPKVSITGDDVFCEKEKVNLIANSTTNNYLWNTGSKEKSIKANVGNYSVTTTDSRGCKNFTNYAVKQNPKKQTLELDSVYSIRKRDSIQLFPKFKQQPDSLRWLPPTGLSCDTCLNPFFSPTKTTIYQIIAWKNGCPINALIRLNVQQKQDKDVYVPNVFSPNGDNINDIFTIYKHPNLSKVNSLRIFDRWGSLMYEGYNFEPEVIGWDGYWRGQLADQAIYVWYGEVLFKDGTTQWLKGDVMLMW
jgi:gliding motility-associated-like protein